jgi:hypothetical protein
MTDMYRIPEVQVRGHSGEVIGIVIHVMTDGRLRRASMTSAVVRNDPETSIQEKHHLRIPVIRGQRPAM